jgi:hypothetical protein
MELWLCLNISTVTMIKMSFQPGVAAHAYNPNNLESEVEELRVWG